MRNNYFVFVLFLFALWGCKNANQEKDDTQQFLEAYSKEYAQLMIVSNEADWKSNTMIVEGDSSNSIATRKAKEAFANFTGSIANIENAKKFLAQKESITKLQVSQLERVLYNAANQPQTVPELVSKRIKAETEQTEKMFGFNFMLADTLVSTNDIDEILRSEKNEKIRLEAWTASKEVGKVLKTGLVELRNLRNETVQNLGYPDYFTYQVSDYGMTNEEMLQMIRMMDKELSPLFRELHTYVRYELAKRYNVKEVPDLIPAHWLPNRWGQDWSSLVELKGFDLNKILNKKDDIWMVKQGERFYKSMGFPSLPKSFWDKSSLYAFPQNIGFKKNNHASAWHMDLDNDVRCLMSVTSNAEWYETIHHELGHIYYFMEYSNPKVPILLREGANRAFHEALGSLMGLAAMQSPFLKHLELIPKDTKIDTINTLLKEALNYVVFIPFSAGVMTEFEHQLYAKNLPPDQFNKVWWDLVAKYQGIAPPTDRGEEYCDAATKTHINDDPAQYYDYAMSYILLFQIHDHISRKILKQDPHFTNYYDKKEIGKFIGEIMTPGLTVDWRELIKKSTGEEISAKAIINYFEPLIPYLKKVNEGRKYTIGHSIE